MIDANSLDTAGQGLNPGCLALICVLSATSHSLKECQQLHAAGLTPTVSVGEEGMASCKFSAYWIPVNGCQLQPSSHHFPDTPISVRILSLEVKDFCALSLQRPQGRVQGVCIRDSLCPLYMAGRNTIQQISL